MSIFNEARADVRIGGRNGNKHNYRNRKKDGLFFEKKKAATR